MAKSFNGELKQPSDRLLRDMDRLLSIIEHEGMLPPEYQKRERETKDYESVRLVNEWDDE